MKIKILSLALLFMFFAAKAVTPLKLNLEKDKVYSVISKSESSITQTMNGMQVDITGINVMKINFSLVSSQADFMVLNVTFDSVVNEMNMPGRSMVVNSAKPGDPKNPEVMMSNAYNILSKNKLEVKLKPSGKLIEIVNIKSVVSEVMKSLDSLPQHSQAQMRPMLEMTVNEAGLKSMVESLFAYFPENNETDAWTSKMIFSAQGMTLEIKSNFKVKDTKGNQVTLTGESTIEPSGDGKMKMNGMEFAFEMRGMGNGDLTIDSQTGVILKGKGKQRMQGSVSANGMNIPMQIEVKTEFLSAN